MTANASIASLPSSLNPPHNPVLGLWRFFNAIPGGRYIFDRLLDRRLPYGASIDQQVEVLRPGEAQVRMSDRRGARNHANAIHAAAVMNLAQTAGGLAVTSLLPEGSEATVQSATIDHRKSGRGPLTAECKLEKHETITAAGTSTITTEVLVRDSRRHIVAEAQLSWRVGEKAAQ